MNEIVLYGIANCDTIKKARNWLADRGVAFEFHDYRKAGLAPELLETLEAGLGWESMLNRRGTTWRGLAADEQEQIDRDGALRIMREHPAIIKRPILACDDKLYLGFSEQQYREIFDLR